MAITIDGKTFRNLEEQVQKNKEDIANHYAIDRVLANFGIKVVGQIADASGLPDPVTYEGAYGDAYAVGASEPYNFFIYTRPDVNSGHPDNYWLDVGGLAIVGPQGPQGVQGPKGETGASSTWFAGVSPPFENNKNGDMFLQLNSGDATGNIYRYVAGSGWQGPEGNIRGPQGTQGARGLQGIQGPQGPQGPQGVQGPQGTPGQTFYVEGILENTGQLPTPTQEIRAKAYLIPSETVSGEYDMWVIVGGPNEGDTLTWFNAGQVTTQGGGASGIVITDTSTNEELDIALEHALNGGAVMYSYPIGNTTNYIPLIRIEKNASNVTLIFSNDKLSDDTNNSNFSLVLRRLVHKFTKVYSLNSWTIKGKYSYEDSYLNSNRWTFLKNISSASPVIVNEEGVETYAKYTFTDNVDTYYQYLVMLDITIDSTKKYRPLFPFITNGVADVIVDINGYYCLHFFVIDNQNFGMRIYDLNHTNHTADYLSHITMGTPQIIAKNP